jgi:hypothetical protein
MQSIGDAARSGYRGPLVSDALYSRIIWFHKYPSPQGDVDNIVKKIHDSLKDIVFADDRVITHTLAVRVDATDGVEIAPDPNSPGAAAALIESVEDPAHRDILYIEIGRQTDARVYLGPVQ